MYLVTHYHPNYISHHGILGQKWGIRRYQNPDGTYTAEGKARRAGLTDKDIKKLQKDKSKGSSYLNPPKGNSTINNIRSNLGGEWYPKSSRNRKKVGDEYSKNYWKLVEQECAKLGKEPYWADVDPKKVDKLWTSYYDKYAEATIKDLKLTDTKETRKYLSDELRRTDTDSLANNLVAQVKINAKKINAKKFVEDFIEEARNNPEILEEGARMRERQIEETRQLAEKLYKNKTK